MFTIWVTKACNMRCKYCYEGSEKEYEFMTAQTAEAVIDWILKTISPLKRKIFVVRFHGGEPLLNIGIIKFIIEKLNKTEGMCFVFQITTNAYCLEQEVLEYVTEHMSGISVSLDGNKTINDINRLNILGESTFAVVLKNAKAMQKKYLGLQIRMTVDSITCEELSKNVLYLVGEGFLSIDAEIDFFDEGWTKEKVDFLERECLIVYRKLSKLKVKTNISLPIGFKPFKKSCCMGGINEFNIDPTGRIYPCSYAVGDEELCIGNVSAGICMHRQGKLREINMMEMKSCVGCGGYESCVNVRCRIVNKKIMGDYLKPIPLICELHRRNAKFQKN